MVDFRWKSAPQVNRRKPLHEVWELSQGLDSENTKLAWNVSLRLTLAVQISAQFSAQLWLKMDNFRRELQNFLFSKSKKDQLLLMLGLSKTYHAKEADLDLVYIVGSQGASQLGGFF